MIAEIRKRVTDVNTELTISLFSAYGAFIPADQLGVSGVLAVVTCGLYLGFRAPEIASLESRMQGFAMWSILTFLLNAALFILIGLQLPTIVDGLARQAGRRGGRLCRARLRRGDRCSASSGDTITVDHPDARPAALAASRGARAGASGSSAAGRGCAAPSRSPPRWRCPCTPTPATPLPGRDLIQFITFSLILVTVVGQGLTLPWLIRQLGVIEDGTDEENEELKARLVIARAALERVDELEERGMDPGRDDRAGPRALRVPAAALQGPGREDRRTPTASRSARSPTSG